METITTGESIQTTPAVIPAEASPQEQPSVEERFEGLLADASSRMAGAVPQTAPVAGDSQDAVAKPDAPVDLPPVEPAEKPAPAAEEAPRLVKLKVNGEELELPEDKLVVLAQQGVDYTKKTQALSERARQLDAWSAVIERIQGDPALQARFRALFDEQHQGKPQAPQAQEPPADPIDRLKWEIRQEVLAEVDAKVKPLAEKPQVLEQAMQLQAFKNELQRDPAYPQAMQLVQQYVANQPPFVRDDLYRRLDSDPRAFMEVYGPARAHALAQAQQASPQPPVATPPEAVPTPLQRKVVPRETPTLESAGGANTGSLESAKRAQELKTLTKRVKTNQATGTDLVDYLNLSGAFRRMGI